MKKLWIPVTLIVMLLILSGCWQKIDGDGMVYEDPEAAPSAASTETAETIDLTVIPDGCQLVPYEQFKEGFALISNVSLDKPVATMEELTEAFGVEGIHYPNCDTVREDTQYRAYAWFADEDYTASMKVAVGIVFKEEQETGRLVYYSYGAQGIDYTDVQ